MSTASPSLSESPARTETPPPALDWREAEQQRPGPMGGAEQMWYSIILPRIHAFLPASDILEINPGLGRTANFLRFWCDRLTLVGTMPACIQACRDRFADSTHLTCHVNDGQSLEMIPDASIDFVFSWDSLVLTERQAIRGYLRQLAAKLRPGGAGFIHHSNLGELPHLHGHDPRSLGGRRTSMSAPCFRDDCREFGLRCLTQEIVPWPAHSEHWLDCFSLFMHDQANAHVEPRIVYRRDWKSEVMAASRLAGMYRRPSSEC